MQNVATKHYDFEDFRSATDSAGPERQSARQLMRMYTTARELHKPVILELGTSKGESTTVFLQACEEADGQLISVDIQDCSDVSDSPRWQFVQADSTHVEKIILNAPRLSGGIDVLYVDSLHQKRHVEKELTRWYPFLNNGAHIFVDDVDSNPYRVGNRKDNVRAEIAFDEIREYVEAFFYANESDIDLEMLFGSTGLAHLHKLSPRGTLPRAASSIRHRRKNIAVVIHYPKLIRRWLARRRAADPRHKSVSENL